MLFDRGRADEAGLDVASLPHITAQQRKDLLHFVVVGGGATGVELASELRDLITDNLPSIYPRELVDLARVSIFGPSYPLSTALTAQTSPTRSCRASTATCRSRLSSTSARRASSSRASSTSRRSARASSRRRSSATVRGATLRLADDQSPSASSFGLLASRQHRCCRTCAAPSRTRRRASTSGSAVSR